MSMKRQSNQLKRYKVRPIIWAGGFAAVCLAFLFGAIVFELNYVPHDHSFKPEAQVRSLTQAMILYAGNHEDTFPGQDNWEQVLLAQALIDPDMLVSSLEDGDGVSYIFVPGDFSFSPTQILIYEDPKHFEDHVLVGFADAHVEFIDHETFEQMLADQLAAQSSP